jgi:hypothetical protein
MLCSPSVPANEKGRLVFLLSPANLGGERARMLLRDGARFDLAQRVRKAEGAPIGEVFSFISGLYFRGKLAYATAFARPPEDLHGAWVITPTAGLIRADERIGIVRLNKFARGSIDLEVGKYKRPLLRDARVLADRAGDCSFVLLGSIATDKYVGVLLDVFGDRLLFPSEFVGRGDMSRGGLMLRSVDAGRELEYVPVRGAKRHGARPAKLAPRRPRRGDGDATV